jgi:methylphosphotriester-DNA--protein-cysteine methyltransferase
VTNPVLSSDGLHTQFDAEFTLTELSMQQAEDLASSIKALDDGNVDV